LLLFVLAATFCSGAVCAKHMYQYTDAQGVVHYTDVQPDGDVEEVKSSVVRVEHQPLIRLRENGSDSDRDVIFVNAAGGPVSVAVDFVVAENVRSEPPLPARIVASAQRETPAMQIAVLNPKASFRYQLRFRSVPGDYRARPDDSVRYQLPFPPDRQFRISQAFEGKFSHYESQNRYAVDIAMPEGTPILAARDGIVMTVDNDFYGAGSDLAKYADRANNIRIVHSDGTMAVYAHLMLESARVQVGDHVRAGQQLALSGDTGFTRGPHLHFCLQSNADMDLIAVPFRFTSTKGDFTPQAGMLIGGN